MKLFAQIGKSIFYFFRFFFHWRKPTFIEFHINDWVFDKKPLLVLKWRTKYGYCVKVKGTNFSLNSREGFHIIRLPVDAKTVIVMLKSGWRSSSYVVKLKKMSIPMEFEQTISLDFLAVQFPVIEKFWFYTAWKEAVHILPLQINNRPIYTRQLEIHINPIRYSSD